MNNLFLKPICNDAFQTTNVLNAIGNYPIKECFHWSFLF